MLIDLIKMFPKTAAFVAAATLLFVATGILGTKLGYAERDLRLAQAETAKCQASLNTAQALAEQRKEAANRAIDAAKKLSSRDRKVATEILTIPAPAEPNALPSIIYLIESERKDSTK